VFEKNQKKWAEDIINSEYPKILAACIEGIKAVT
jgi:hypothetical protein